MVDLLQSVSISIVALGAAAIAALWMAASRPTRAAAPHTLSAARALGTATLVQAVHFTEEAATGFDRAFPGLLGLPPIPMSLFVGFNLACLLAWTVAVSVRGYFPGLLTSPMIGLATAVLWLRLQRATDGGRA